MACAAIAGAGATLVGLRRTQPIPRTFAAVGVECTNAILHLGILATRRVVSDAARPFARTPAAVLGAVLTGLVAVARTVPAHRADGANLAHLGRFVGAKAIPLNVAAEGVRFAHHSLAWLVVAARVEVACAAIAGAGAALVGLRRTQSVPRSLATVRVKLAHAVLHCHVRATGRTIVDAAGALAGTLAAVLGTGVAVLGFGANTVTAVAYSAAVQAAIVDGLAHADGIPHHIAAVGVQVANAGLDGGVFAAGSVAGLAAVAESARARYL